MMKNIFFTPGPSELYFTVAEHIKQALQNQIPSISHRSKTFEGIFEEAVTHLRDLLNIPAAYHIFFTGSATEIWERIIENCVEKNSFHAVNGAFSERFYQTALELGKTAAVSKAREGSCLTVEEMSIPEDTELIALTHNETSTGAAQPVEDIYKIRKAYPDKLIAVDAVSSLPYPDLDYTQIDTAFFSVQKGFGLPAGLGVWIVNDRCLEKAVHLQEQGISIGSYHTLPALLDKARKNQTPETPNVLNIYLLAKVCGDMLQKGIAQIRRETDYKAALLYHTLENHPVLAPFVKEQVYRSQTVIVAETPTDSSKVVSQLKESGLVVGSGYGSYKAKHVRIANFPTHSKEQIEMLADRINTLK